MSIIVSLVMLAFGIYIIVKRPKDQQAREFAFFDLGLLLAYWLKSG